MSKYGRERESCSSVRNAKDFVSLTLMILGLNVRTSALWSPALASRRHVSHWRDTPKTPEIPRLCMFLTTGPRETHSRSLHFNRIFSSHYESAGIWMPLTFHSHTHTHTHKERSEGTKERLDCFGWLRCTQKHCVIIWRCTPFWLWQNDSHSWHSWSCRAPPTPCLAFPTSYCAQQPWSPERGALWPPVISPLHRKAWKRHAANHPANALSVNGGEVQRARYWADENKKKKWLFRR